MLTFQAIAVSREHEYITARRIRGNNELNYRCAAVQTDERFSRGMIAPGTLSPRLHRAKSFYRHRFVGPLFLFFIRRPFFSLCPPLFSFFFVYVGG